MSKGDGGKFNILLIYFGTDGEQNIHPLLQNRQKWTKSERNMQLGDIVLIADNAPRIRGTWLSD